MTEQQRKQITEVLQHMMNSGIAYANCAYDREHGYSVARGMDDIERILALPEEPSDA